MEDQGGRINARKANNMLERERDELHHASLQEMTHTWVVHVGSWRQQEQQRVTKALLWDSEGTWT